MFSMCPPSDRFSQGRSSAILMPVISRIRQKNPGVFSHSLRLGCRIQKPRRTLRKVNKAVRVGMDSIPMCDDAAAPEIAMIVAKSGGALLVRHPAVGK